MRKFEIEDYYRGESKNLFSSGTVIEANSGRKALDKYLKNNNINLKVAVSSCNNVVFKVTPIVVCNGRVIIDRRNGQRAYWYKIIQ